MSQFPAARPAIRVRVVPRLPAYVVPGGGVHAAMSGGRLDVGLDFASLFQDALPDPTVYRLVAQHIQTGEYRAVSAADQAKASGAIQTLTLERFGGDPSGNNPAANDAALAKAKLAADATYYGAEVRLQPGAFYRFGGEIDLDITPGKSFSFVGPGNGFGTKVQYVGNQPMPFLRAGGPSSGYDSGNLRIGGFSVVAPINPAANVAGARPIDIDNRGGTQLFDLVVTGYDRGLRMSRSYGPRLTDVTFVAMKGRAIEFVADGTCNNAILISVTANGGGFTYGESAAKFAGDPGGTASNAFTMIGCDFENNALGPEFAGIFGGTVIGLYSEFNGAQNVFFSAPCEGLDFSGCWLGEQSAPLTFANLSRSSVRRSTLYNATVTYDAGAYDLEADFMLRGTASITNLPALRPLTLANSWAASPGREVPGYRRRSDGTVTFSGSMAGGGDYTVAFNVPAPFRPSKPRSFLVAAGENDTVIGLVTIGTNGNAVVHRPAGYEAVALDGIEYRL